MRICWKKPLQKYFLLEMLEGEMWFLLFVEFHMAHTPQTEFLANRSEMWQRTKGGSCYQMTNK